VITMKVLSLVTALSSVALAGCNLIIGLEEGTPSQEVSSVASCDPAMCPGADDDCSFRACDVDRSCRMQHAESGAACDDAGGRVCNGEGQCVGCVSAADCRDDALPACVAHRCVVEHCANGSEDDDETDVDCGGVDCAGCDNGQACTDPADCLSGACVNAICAACSGKIDCPDGNYCASGVCVRQKPLGANCADAMECSSDSCVDGVCCESSCAACHACNIGGSLGTCVALPNGSGCDDGIFCNGTDSCNAGSCTDHSGYPCLDNSSSCNDACDESTQACTGYEGDYAPCNVGGCNDYCMYGGCQYGGCY